MTAHYVEVVNGRYVVYTIGRGMAHISVGPGWPTPREAARYADLMDNLDTTSPLRSRGETSPDGLGSSPGLTSVADVSPSQPRGDSPARRGR